MMAAERIANTVLLSDLLRGVLDAPLLHDVEISGLAFDSRAVAPGDLFFAVQGVREHGLAHLDQAVERGAAAILWEPGNSDAVSSSMVQCAVPCYRLDKLASRMGEIAGIFHGHPSESMHCIGVTGTDGKTSVTHFIAQALHTAQSPCGLLGTLGYGIFGKLQAPTHTTPDALRIQAELANLRDQQVDQLVMEVSSHALDQYRVSGIHFDTAVLTNLSREHLDYHGDMASYAAAKQRLFRMAGLETIVVNLDDSFGVDLLAEMLPGQRAIAYSIDEQFKPPSRHEWLWARKVRAQPRGTSITVAASWGEGIISTGLLGRFNVANLLAAAAALLATGLSFAEVMQRLSSVATVPGRMEVFGAPHQPLVVVDYAHTANALQKALQALREHCSGKLYCVFGAGGDRDPGKRSGMGAVAEQYADLVVITSDNPRTENPLKIIDMIASGLQRPDRALQIPDRKKAIATVIRMADAGSVVLVAGKGHESWQHIGGQRLPFSDRDQVRNILREGKV